VTVAKKAICDALASELGIGASAHFGEASYAGLSRWQEENSGMRATPWHPLLWSLTLATAFLAGMVAEHLGQSEAHAQSAQSTSTIYVPPGGLVFRTLDGKPIARIGRDAHGNSIELYDSDHETASRVLTSDTAVADEKPVSASPYVLDPYLLDEDDPWAARASAPPQKPGPGF
jgi:hypothetical protein